LNAHLKQIIELSKYDKEIESFGPKFESIDNKLNELIKMRDDKEAQLVELDEKQIKIKNDIDTYKERIEENRNKIIELSKKSSEVKTTKEMQALQVEDDFAKENIEKCNDDIAKLEDTLERLDGTRNTLKSDIEEDNDLIKEFEASTKDQKEKLEKDRHNISETRNELLSKMEHSMITFYEKVKLWAKSTAVVPVKKQACYGCYMKLNDKVYAEVIKGEEIVTCHHCGRILYKEEEEEQ
jgi:predicted  nucleic acid-binding Zn-ribbon protein